MPKKREHFRSYKPIAPASATLSSSSNSSDKPSTSRNVNDLLANLRRTSAGPAPSVEPVLAVNTPSVPPAIRQILQIPETPAPPPRRRGRARFDASGRRLPAGPPPPNSWVSASGEDASRDLEARIARLNISEQGYAALPGTYLPENGSLIDIILRNLAADWDFQRSYNQYHLYFLPHHLKPALIRLLGLSKAHGVSSSDLRLLLLPPTEAFEDEEFNEDVFTTQEVTYIDLSSSLGRSIKLKDLAELLFPTRWDDEAEEPQDSWDATADISPSPPRVLLPLLTHLSLALDPHNQSGGSWKQLLALSPKISSITHLSLAFWPDPCLTPRSRYSSVTSPQGQKISYGGTNYYSHSLDHDWSEALLVMRMLSRNLYELEFLDLTGCGPWFQALMMRSDHDYVDWAGSWGKISELRLRIGWQPTDTSLLSEQVGYNETLDMAANVEKHIRTMRAGKGRFINVDRDRRDP